MLNWVLHLVYNFIEVQEVPSKEDMQRETGLAKKATICLMPWVNIKNLTFKRLGADK